MKLGLSLFDAVAVDYNGTLGDTNNAHLEARETAFKTCGITNVTPEQHKLGYKYGIKTKTIVAGLLKEAKVIPDSADPYTNPLVVKIAAIKKANYYRFARAGFAEIPGSTDFLKRMTSIKGLGNVSIVTTAHMEEVAMFVGDRGLSSYVDSDLIIASETVSELGKWSKPAADPYLLAARRMNVPAERMLVIENSTGGVESAKKAGCLTLALGTTYPIEVFTDASLEFHPDLFAPSFGEIELVP